MLAQNHRYNCILGDNELYSLEPKLALKRSVNNIIFIIILIVGILCELCYMQRHHLCNNVCQYSVGMHLGNILLQQRFTFTFTCKPVAYPVGVVSIFIRLYGENNHKDHLFKIISCWCQLLKKYDIQTEIMKRKVRQ